MSKKSFVGCFRVTAVDVCIIYIIVLDIVSKKIPDSYRIERVFPSIPWNPLFFQMLTLNESVDVRSNVEMVRIEIFFFCRYRVELDSDIDIRKYYMVRM